MIILSGHDIKKLNCSNFDCFAEVKNCISRLVTTPCTHANHYWQKQSFLVFHMGYDRP